MSQINLLVIAPYKGLDTIIKDLMENIEGVNADYYISNLNEVNSVLEEINVLDYDAIISRGGTASLLNNLVSIPVYDVGVSALDALRAVTLAQNFSQDMAIIAYERITKTMYTLAELLQWKYPIITISSEEEVAAHLKDLAEHGIKAIVCDVIASRLAPEFGINAVLVTSGYETVQATLIQAIQLTRRYLGTRQELSHLTLAFQNSPYGCTVFDRSGKIIFSRFDITDPDHIMNYIKEHQEELLKEDAGEFERPFRGGVLSFVMHKRYLQNEQYTYLFARFHDRPETRKIAAISQRTADASDRMDYTYYNSSHFMANTIEQITKYSKSGSPVIICGEDGTGKDQAAFFIYRKSTYQNAIFYRIDCETATDKNWNYLFTHHDSPLMHNKHAIYFRHVNLLPYTVFRKLMAFTIDTNLAKRNRLIFSFVTNRSSEDNTYLRDMTQQITCLTLRIPALRERTEDIPYLCTLYINRYNASLGKQIIGFDAKALNAMKNFGWEGNLFQLRRIIEELMLVTTTSYISYEATMRKLAQENALWTSPESSSLQFNLDRTLSEINRDIVKEVLKEENGNHTKAAARLGIGRSTLWRMLQE